MNKILDFIKQLDLPIEILSKIQKNDILQHLIIELLELDSLRTNLILSDKIKLDIIKNNIIFIVKCYDKERLVQSTIDIWNRYVGPLSKKVEYFPKVYFPKGNVAIFDKLELNRLCTLGKIGIKYHKTGGVSAISKIWHLNQLEPDIELSYDPTVKVSKSHDKVNTRDMYINFKDYFHDVHSIGTLINSLDILKRITYVNIGSLRQSLEKYWPEKANVILELKSKLLRLKLKLEREAFGIERHLKNMDRERILLKQNLMDARKLDKLNRSMNTYSDKLIISKRQNDLNKVSVEMLSLEKIYNKEKSKLSDIKSKLRLYVQVYNRLDIVIPLLNQ